MTDPKERFVVQLSRNLFFLFYRIGPEHQLDKNIKPDPSLPKQVHCGWILSTAENAPVFHGGQDFDACLEAVKEFGATAIKVPK
jgi:hypothetical protein